MLTQLLFGFRPLFYLGMVIFSRFNALQFLHISKDCLMNWLRVSFQDFNFAFFVKGSIIHLSFALADNIELSVIIIYIIGSTSSLHGHLTFVLFVANRIKLS